MLSQTKKTNNKMTYEISSTMLYFLEKELRVLEGGKIEKIYQLDKETILLRIYTQNGKKTLRITMPSMICLTKQEYEAPMNPPGFCMFLRKYLTNARIINISQKEFERILEIKFSTKQEEYILIIELFKPGNIILCKKESEELTVINAHQKQIFKDREILARKQYIYPPLLINPIKISETEMFTMINESDRNLVKTMAQKLGFGGIYAEELLARASVNKEKEKITKEDANKIINAIKEFFEEEIKPSVDKKNIYPFEMKTIKTESADDLNEAIDNTALLQEIEKKTNTTEKKKNKTQSLVEIQEQMIKKLEKEIQENQEKGEFIYSNYQDFKKLIDEANNIRNKNGLDTLEKIMKQNKKFISINKKEKEIKLRF